MLPGWGEGGRTGHQGGGGKEPRGGELGAVVCGWSRQRPSFLSAITILSKPDSSRRNQPTGSLVTATAAKALIYWGVPLQGVV